MTYIPPEVWSLIEAHVLPNPYTYTRLSHVCRGSRAVFGGDAVWAKFTPYDLASGYAPDFYRRMAALPRHLREKYRILWNELEQAQIHDISEADLEEATMRNLLFRGQFFDPEVLRVPDMWLAGHCWGHMMCISWLTPEIFSDRASHASFVRNLGVRTRAFSLAAARLYGVTLRYFDEQELDDEEIVLAAAKSRFLPEVDAAACSAACSPDDRFYKSWKHIPQYKWISERLRRQPHVSLAYISRWPQLACDLPENLREDPLFKSYID